MALALLAAWILTGIAGIAFSQWVLVAAFALIGGIGYLLAIRGGRPFRSDRIYVASRLTRDNLLFPTQVAILPTRIVRYKTRVIGHHEESISIAQVASVKIKTGVLWSDLIIESTGGQNQIVCHGHTNQDATLMQAEIEGHQQAYFARVPKAPVG
jgi:hypothetical protein